MRCRAMVRLFRGLHTKAFFAVVGTDYGVGDGSTTFNVPSIADMVAANGTDVTAWIRR